MTEERLKEIKDSIDLQHRMAVRFDMDNDVIGLIDEELELYNEVVRLREIIDKAIKDIEENTHNVYASGYRDKWGNFETVDKTPIIIKIYRKNPKELLDILKQNNLTLEQLTGVENE